MVFLIQSTQNTDTEALQIKLDELIRVMDDAQNALLDLEEMEEGHLDEIRARYRKLAAAARESREHHRRDSETEPSALNAAAP